MQAPCSIKKNTTLRIQRKHSRTPPPLLPKNKKNIDYVSRKIPIYCPDGQYYKLHTLPTIQWGIAGKILTKIQSISTMQYSNSQRKHLHTECVDSRILLKSEAVAGDPDQAIPVEKATRAEPAEDPYHVASAPPSGHAYASPCLQGQSSGAS